MAVASSHVCRSFLRAASTSYPDAVWDIEAAQDPPHHDTLPTDSNSEQDDGVLHAFRLQPGALDLAPFVSKLSLPGPQQKQQPSAVIVTTLSDGRKEYCIQINGKDAVSLVRETRMAGAYTQRDTTVVELYTSAANATDISQRDTTRRKRLRRLCAPVKGVLVIPSDNWQGMSHESSSLLKNQLNDYIHPEGNRRTGRSSCSLTRGCQHESLNDPLSKYPPLCSPELLLRAKNVVHLARYIQLSSLSSHYGALMNGSTEFVRKSSLDLLHRIKSVLNANAALFACLTAGEAGRREEDLGSPTKSETKRKRNGRRDSCESELLRRRRSEDLRLLLRAYNCLVNACTPNECERD